MATVYCLQHTDYMDKPTGVHFEELKPVKEVRTEEDELGRRRTLYAQSVAEVTDPGALEHFKDRPWLFDVRGNGESRSTADYEAVHRVGPWWDVEGPDGRVNEKSLKEDDARALAAELNEED